MPRSRDIHVQRHTHFQIALPEHLLHQQIGIDRAALRRQDDANILSAFVMDIVQQR